MSTLSPLRRSLAAALLLAGTAGPALAQQLAPPAPTQLPAPAPARPCEFLTLTAFQSSTRDLARLLIAPAFNGRAEISLAKLSAFTLEGRLENLRHNDEVLARTLNELSAAGWELVLVSQQTLELGSAVPATRYLLRRPRP